MQHLLLSYSVPVRNTYSTYSAVIHCKDILLRVCTTDTYIFRLNCHFPFCLQAFVCLFSIFNDWMSMTEFSATCFCSILIWKHMIYEYGDVSYTNSIHSCDFENAWEWKLNSKHFFNRKFSMESLHFSLTSSAKVHFEMNMGDNFPHGKQSPELNSVHYFIHADLLSKLFEFSSICLFLFACIRMDIPGACKWVRVEFTFTQCSSFHLRRGFWYIYFYVGFAYITFHIGSYMFG